MIKFASLAFALCASVAFAAGTPEPKFHPNDLVKFLTGKWDNVSFEIATEKPVKREAYSETMVAKSEHVLTITAHGFRNGKDITKDMNFEVQGENIVISQGSFKAIGKREGNV